MLLTGSDIICKPLYGPGVSGQSLGCAMAASCRVWDVSGYIVLIIFPIHLLTGYHAH